MPIEKTISPIVAVTIIEDPERPGLAALVERRDGSSFVQRVKASYALTLYEMRGAFARAYPGADVGFDPALVPDPDYTGREAA